MSEMDRTITLTPEVWAKKTARVMKKIMNEAKDADAYEVSRVTLQFLVIQGLIFDELFREEEEVTDA